MTGEKGSVHKHSKPRERRLSLNRKPIKGSLPGEEYLDGDPFIDFMTV
jgi:hypothetical protein